MRQVNDWAFRWSIIEWPRASECPEAKRSLQTLSVKRLSHALLRAAWHSQLCASSPFRSSSLRYAWITWWFEFEWIAKYVSRAQIHGSAPAVLRWHRPNRRQPGRTQIVANTEWLP